MHKYLRFAIKKLAKLGPNLIASYVIGLYKLFNDDAITHNSQTYF